MFTYIADTAKLPPLPDLLEPNGVMKLLPVATLDRIDRNSLRYWCHVHGRYGLPTRELVEWLSVYVGGRSAIEIGSGAGDFAHHLAIRGTDLYLQNWPEIKAYYARLGQPTIVYPPWIERMEAMEAINKYKPDVVFGSWITQWVDPRDKTPLEGSTFGVQEDALLRRNVTYVLIGNLQVHRAKRILQQPHKQFKLPFLRSRSANPSLDRVFVWPSGDSR